MTFRVGQKVVCINDAPSRFHGGACSAVKGRCYTITKSWFCHMWQHPCVLIAEAHPNGGYAFDAERFRSIVERKTDISVFNRMLLPQGENADA